MNSTGHRYVSPGFPFVDDDHDLELIEMSKISDQLKMSTFAQLAAITSGDFELYYNEFENMIDEAGEDADVTLSRIIENSFQGSDKRDVQMTKAQMPAGLKELVCSVGTPGQYTTEAECTGAGGKVTWKFTFKHLLNNFGVEIGGGLGDFAGKVWRIGLMGYNSKASNVDKIINILETELPKFR